MKKYIGLLSCALVAVILNVSIANCGTWGVFPLSIPTVQASNIAFSNITRTSMKVQWTRGNGDKCVMLSRESYRIPDVLLADNSTYIAHSPSYTDILNSVISGTKVLYNGNASSPSVEVTGLTKYKLYYFKICEYTGDAGEELYLQTSNVKNPASRWTLRKEDDAQAVETDFKLYPNPANDVIHCNLQSNGKSQLSYGIYSTQGAIVKSGIINLSSDKQIDIQISDLPNGAYYLSISDGADVIFGLFDIVR